MALASRPMRRDVECVALDLPKPISTNSLWRTTKGGGWYLSPQYKAWKEEVGYCVNAQRAGCVNGPYAMTVNVTHKWRADLDNALKSLADALQCHGVITDDKLCQEIKIRRSTATAGMSVLIVKTSEVA